ncbi:hypothetical protein QYF36_010884 [Acer negundo]|nr:hypothetical protein QYF36_010884 [Acer negundo]
MKSKVEKLHQEQDRILGNILDEHIERKQTTKTGQGEAEEDLVDVFLRLQQDGDLEFPLTNNSIKAVIWDIFVGGSETSSTTVEWAMSEMLKNPRVMKEAQAELPNGMNEEDLDMTEAFGLTVRRKNDLILIPVPCRPFLDI